MKRAGSIRGDSSPVKTGPKSRFNSQRLCHYSTQQKIGEGASATVYKATKISTGQTYAIKKISQQIFEEDKKLKKLLHNQFVILKECQNPNVVRCYEKILTPKNIYLVMEYCNGGDLDQYLANNGRVSEMQATVFLKEILNGFKGLHQVGAMHRDFKLSNVLLHNGICKICDLGFAKQVQEQKTHYKKHEYVHNEKVSDAVLGTTITMAPQVLEGSKYGFQVDIWSIGAVFYQLLFAKPPYNGKNDYQVLKNIKKGELVFNPNIQISIYAKDFIQKCLTYDPEKRISWKQIYEHPLINKKARKQQLSTDTSAKNLIDSANLGFSPSENQQFYRKTILVEKNRSYNSEDDFVSVSFDKTAQDISKDKDYQLHTPLKKKVTSPLKSPKKSQPTKSTKQFKQQTQQYLQHIKNLTFGYEFIDKVKKQIIAQQVNHDIPCFLICKQIYFKLNEMGEKMDKKVNILALNTKVFKQFVGSQDYKNVRMGLTDLEKSIKSSCLESTYKITLCPALIHKELNFSQKFSQNYEELTKSVMRQYEKVLIEALCAAKSSQKQSFLKYIFTVQYYNNARTPNPKQFTQKLHKLDTKKYQTQLLNTFFK